MQHFSALFLRLEVFGAQAVQVDASDKGVRGTGRPHEDWAADGGGKAQAKLGC